MEVNQLQWYNTKLREMLSPDEVKAVMTKSDWKGALEILDTWGWIAFAFAIAGLFPNIFTIVIALFILGGKQLGCAIIMHDCSHDSVFTSRKANQIVGNWFGAYPIMHNLEQYRPYHREHHIYTGLDNDPDLSLTKGYPTTALSMFRKFLRDLSGATGIKAQIGVIAMHIGVIKYNLGGVIERIKEKKDWSESISASAKNLAGPIASNLILFGLLWLVGAPWLYLLWIGALLTTYNFCLRVRSIAEHSVVHDRQNPQKNTRTTYANFIEKLLFAPHHVNYHAEHHLCMGAPPYNLPMMHKMLLQKGFYNDGVLAPNYWDNVKHAVKA
jgi:fatty acid desaturase